MKNLLLLLLLGSSAFSFAQQKLSFDYDAAGNQTMRSWCSNCHDRAAATSKTIETFKLVEDLQEEDLQQFFPEDELSYYPNPVKEELFLKWKNTPENAVTSIQLYDLKGQLLLQTTNLKSTTSKTFNFSQYPIGTYLLKLVYVVGEEKVIKIVRE